MRSERAASLNGSSRRGGTPMNHIMPTICARRAKIYLSLIGIASLGFLPVANARVTQIIIANTEALTFENNPSFGSVGQYERIEGTITGEVDPKDPLNAIIVDIDRGPKNGNGTGGYNRRCSV